MRFGVREICDVVFKAKSTIRLGDANSKYVFKPGQPVLYIDSAKTSTMEEAATTVYAQGGKGNTNLIAWEGEKTLTFTVEDALLSPISFAMLSGAGLFGGTVGDGAEKVHVHTSTETTVGASGLINLADALEAGDEICTTAPIFVLEEEGREVTGKSYTATATKNSVTITGDTIPAEGTTVIVDYYVLQKGETVSELVIDAENFAGYYYVEASTLFRKQKNGKDMPAELTFPNVKIQSNFTFTMAPTGDPSTFTFTMDAMPGYTYFNRKKKVLCVMQIIDRNAASTSRQQVMSHAEGEKVVDDEKAEFEDSVTP